MGRTVVSIVRVEEVPEAVEKAVELAGGLGIKGGDVVGPNLRLLSQYFIGYTVSVKGAFVALMYSFVWGFLFGWLFAYLRNFFFAFYLYRIKKKAALLSLKDFFDYL